jgi:hypothetical protein
MFAADCQEHGQLRFLLFAEHVNRVFGSLLHHDCHLFDSSTPHLLRSRSLPPVIQAGTT